MNNNTIFVKATLHDGREVFTWISQRDIYEGNEVYAFVDKDGEMIPIVINAGEITHCEEQ